MILYGQAPVNFKVNGEVIRILAGKNGSIQGPCEEKGVIQLFLLPIGMEMGKRIL